MKGEKMRLCPICNHKLYEKFGGGFYCKYCKYVNNPNYLKQKDEYEDYENGKLKDKKQKKLGEFK